jgi:hypothetical protein
MSGYNYRILHRKGKENANADALSRRPDYQGPKEVVKQALFRKEADGSLVHQAARIEPRTDRGPIIEAQENDQLLQQLRKENPDQFSEENGLAIYDGRIYLPSSIREKTILGYHEPPLEGHARPEVVLERLQRTYYFPRMRQTVYQQVHKCDKCRKAKYERHKPYGLLQPVPAPEGPWEDLTMDFVGPIPASEDENKVTYENIWVIVDKLTKYARFIPLPRKYDALYLSKVFIREIVAKHGIPKSIISDRDKILARNFWGELCKLLQIARKLSTAYHPETDGQTERMNQTLEQYLRIYTDEEQQNWVKLLPQAEFVYNNTKQDTIGISPFMALYGREPRNEHTDTERLETAAVKEVKELTNLQRQLSKDITFLNMRMAHYANLKRIEGPTFERGDRVYLWRRNIKTKRPSSKLDHLKLGPFKVKNRKGPVNYELELPKGMKIHPVFHVSLLEPAHPQTPVDNEVELDPETFEEEFEPEEILEAKKVGQRWMYHIKWKGYPHEENTWEPEDHLQNAKTMLQEFRRVRQDQEGSQDPRRRSQNSPSQFQPRQQRLRRARQRAQC